ncbi:unnamed protein product, partial [marine sediment metagenome]
WGGGGAIDEFRLTIVDLRLPRFARNEGEIGEGA